MALALLLSIFRFQTIEPRVADVASDLGGSFGCDSHVIEHSFNPLNAGWDGAARPSLPDNGGGR
jgi:hypothetical protein